MGRKPSKHLLLRAPEDTSDAFLNAPTVNDALDEIANPALARIVRESVWFCWENGRPEYSPSAERRRFMQNYVAGRIPTARLLDEAWAACKAEERDAMRASVLRQVSEPDNKPVAQALEGLADDEVDRLYHATLRKIAKDSHRTGSTFSAQG